MDKKILSQHRARYHIRKGRDPPPDPTPEEEEARRIAREENPFIDPPRLDGESEANYKTRVKSYRASISNKRSRRVKKILKDRERALARAESNMNNTNNTQAGGAMGNNNYPPVSSKSLRLFFLPASSCQVGRLDVLPALACLASCYDSLTLVFYFL